MPRASAATRNYLEQLEALSDAYLACRDLRAHAWTVAEDFHLVEPSANLSGRYGMVVRRSMDCMRCDSECDDNFVIKRMAGFETLVRVGSRVYRYSPGYQLTVKAPAGISASELIKHESYRRAMARVQLEGSDV